MTKKLDLPRFISQTGNVSQTSFIFVQHFPPLLVANRAVWTLLVQDRLDEWRDSEWLVDARCAVGSKCKDKDNDNEGHSNSQS